MAVRVRVLGAGAGCAGAGAGAGMRGRGCAGARAHGAGESQIQQYNTIQELSYFVLYVLLFIKYLLVLIISEPCLVRFRPI